MNLTDIDDKTIKGSQKQSKSLREYTDFYAKAFFEDIKTLNIEPATVYPRATDHIPEMVALIKMLIQKGYAYKGDDGSIYFAINKFSSYGKLSHIKKDELKVGARVRQDEYSKERSQILHYGKLTRLKMVMFTGKLSLERSTWLAYGMQCYEHEVSGQKLLISTVVE